MYANDEGLGINIAGPGTSVFTNSLARDLILKYQTARPVPLTTATSPWPTVTRTTTFTPRTSTPVAKPVARTVTPTAPTLKPTVSLVPTQRTMPVLVSGGASPQIAEENAGMSNAFSFMKSPLPLIVAGVAALFLLNRKGR